MTQQQHTPLSSKQVADYLQQHPEFFNEHLQLLEYMTIPHPSGEAISLVSKQLEIFRSKHRELENQLNALVEIARENDIAFNHMHHLTLALLDAGNLEEAIANLNHVFTEYFLTDFVAIRIIARGEHAALSHLFIDPGDPQLKHFDQILSHNQAKCGRPTLAQAKMLFGEAATEVGSCAIIPMAFTQLEGLIAIGSRQDKRFHYSMGSLFLTQISEIIGTRLISLLQSQ
ncbi:MAG: DUF484 domain-containing protein [Gammaproteobacteria bacterium HGW-Gammaproteobacteria-3]|nr:MAG: DUF484 domain-containing protein [Gammaproteobacteria bacterium HGW-Gammaproteobacteria-3]